MFWLRLKKRQSAIDDRGNRFSIVNTQCAVQDAVSADSRNNLLRELFEEIRKFYKVLPCENLMTSMVNCLIGVLKTIGDLSSIIEDQECDVRIIRGVKILLLSQCHADLIADWGWENKRGLSRYFVD